MTSNEKRQAIVDSALTREKKNQYTNGSKRNEIENGWGDCSATVGYWYRKILGIELGCNTGSQYVNDTMFDIETSGVNKNQISPDLDKLKLGDLIYFKNPNNTSRKDCVGHVEMYIGDGKCFGHGSGLGGTIKNVKDYCNMRSKNDMGYLKTRRVIKDDVTPQSPSKPIKKVNPYKKPTDTVKLGDSGQDVKWVQWEINESGYDKVDVDGKFGKDTKKAVEITQRKLGLDNDGIVGNKTINALYKDK